ncbi:MULTISPECIES: DUF2283 domain-containing protein [Microbacterium]|uniref:DUF2283 domain-containing protein n=1 Tax=Microbacterium maritypicum TaxID=33918 RepID=A0A4Y4BB42_MICMQ|nr:MULTISPECIES: DUF2283 domain-containing protein [Microbacterium]GEC76047.1 hypothetical protein MLI01_21920 [Microbacterium liquefaciens]GGV58948.1 hypothetical protein GCM10010213_21250 [Microbacterium liquefaciens]
MSIRYDPEVDAAYITIGRDLLPGEAAAQVADIRDPRGDGEIILDFDSEGYLLGIEVLHASRLLRAEDLDGATRPRSSWGNGRIDD